MATANTALRGLRSVCARPAGIWTRLPSRRWPSQNGFVVASAYPGRRYSHLHGHDGNDGHDGHDAATKSESDHDGPNSITESSSGQEGQNPTTAAHPDHDGQTPTTERQLGHDGRNPTTKSQSGHGRQAPSSEAHTGGHHGQSVSAEEYLDQWTGYAKHFQLQKQFKPGALHVGKEAGVNGFLQSLRKLNANLVFATVDIGSGAMVQLAVRAEGEHDPKTQLIRALRDIPLHSPIAARGLVTKVEYLDPTKTPRLNPRLDVHRHPDVLLHRVDLDLTHIEALNRMPPDIVIADGARFPAKSRNLQLRFSDRLHNIILFRDAVANRLRRMLRIPGLREIETPLLFKSTPEGAREFLVPSRRHGLAYALPQSPQQFKQMLMASGFRGYFQFARCFRDEDLRADRQPEFTQVDLEMAFASGSDVQEVVEAAITHLQNWLNVDWVLYYGDGKLSPYPRTEMASVAEESVSGWPSIRKSFSHIRYDHAMTKYGTDKPDLRIPFNIQRVEHVLPQDFIRMITHVEKPIVEAFVLNSELHREYNSPFQIRHMFQQFMSTLPKTLARNKDGPPTMLIVDPTLPLDGLSPLGHDGAKQLQSRASGLADFGYLEKGDVLIFQAREDKEFCGESSTAMGTLRKLVYEFAVHKRLVKSDNRLEWLWVTHFPMFTPDTEPGEGQQSPTGIKSTHHPFTAPLTAQDFALMATDPLRALADHYDLVVNGVEVGGGSRRIHLAEMQEDVLRNSLGMSADAVRPFRHLLDALRTGCPPHAGFALGLDRLVAVLAHTDSVRDVIAFPKSMKGDDLMALSPGPVTDEMLERYHLKLLPRRNRSEEEEEKGRTV